MALATSTKVWIHGVVAAFITAFSTAATGALALPTVFNFTHDGLANMAKLTVVPALISVFGYLKASPLPPASNLQPGDTLNVQNPKIAPDSTITGDSAIIQKAPDPAAPAIPPAPKA